MKKFIFAAIFTLVFSSASFGQSRAHSTGRQLYGGYYNGYGYTPGLSIYNNGYQRNYQMSNQFYGWGYQPPRYSPQRYYNPYNVYNNYGYGSGYSSYNWGY